MLQAFRFFLQLAFVSCISVESDSDLTTSLTDNIIQWRSDVTNSGYVNVTLPRNSSGLPSIPHLHYRHIGLNRGIHSAAKSSPVVLGDTFLQAGDTGVLYHIDIKSGEVKWAAAQRQFSRVGYHSTPCVIYRKNTKPGVFGSKDLAVIGSYDGVLSAYDLETGHIVWESVEAGEHIGASPTCTQEAVYISVEFSKPEGGGVCKIDVDTGEKMWCRYTMGKHSHSTPGVDLTNNIVVSGSNDKHLHVFRESDGAKLAKYNCEGDIKGPILLHRGVAVFGSWSNHIYGIDLNSVYSESDEKSLTVKTKPTYKWEPIKTGRYVMSGAALDPETERIYIGGHDGMLRCIDFHSGKVIWKFDLKASTTSSPVVVNNAVLVGSGDGGVYCLDKVNGDKYWRFASGRTGKITSSVDVSEDGEYIMFASAHYDFKVEKECKGKVGSLHVIKTIGGKNKDIGKAKVKDDKRAEGKAEENEEKTNEEDEEKTDEEKGCGEDDNKDERIAEDKNDLETDDKTFGDEL